MESESIVGYVGLPPLHIEIMRAGDAVCRSKKIRLVWGNHTQRKCSFLILPCKDMETWHGAPYMAFINIPDGSTWSRIELPILDEQQVGFMLGSTPVRIHIGVEASCAGPHLLGKTWEVNLHRLGPGPYRTKGPVDYRRLLEFRVRGLRLIGPTTD